ncbi:hypothetical protein C9374_010309 [Naegleria lovaniensis]|uniref:Autophagy-related protein 27 n=1 Tax=Naegleria lovaniensis TaxID=51637 RepID=A0AA88GGA2_NAELO|nr:uncharacterized protein C9374_010309 [Naegleria lovaniensis]KAG2374935.1 hypothetical protein C9374_010309 [Naegleria lovaniensis]
MILNMMIHFSHQQSTQPFCIFKLPDGRVIDLNRATRPDSDYHVYNAQLNYDFYVNLCKDASVPCNGQNYAGVATYTRGSELMCGTYMAGKSIADNYQISLIDSSKPELGVTVQVNNGERFMNKQESMKITMNCKPNGDPVKSFSFLGEVTTQTSISYEFTMDTPHSCIVEDVPLGGLGYFGLTMLIIFILFLLYFIIGYFLNTLVLKKSEGWGISQLPQFEFWKNVLLLSWEGILLIKDGIQLVIFKYILKRSVYNAI